jgi:hypothetical protein
MVTMSGLEPAAGDDGQQRIGDVERAEAVRALDVHRQAGRISATEFEDRQVRISDACTWAQIRPQFDDLPEPYPDGMPSRSANPVRPAAGPVAAPEHAVESGDGILASLVPERYRSTVMALTPLIALLLFFRTGGWMWFLAIPVMGILLYGPDGNDRRKRERRRGR